MIYLVTRDLGLAHSGMKVHIAGLVEISDGLLAQVDIGDLATVPVANDLVIFEEYVGLDGLEWIAWHERQGASQVAYGVLLHSPLLQMDLNDQVRTTLWLLHDRGDGKPLDLVACADRPLTSVLSAAAACPVIWLPHCLPTRSRSRLAEVRRKRDADPALCSMPLTLPDHHSYYRHKNTYCQLAAARSAARHTALPLRVAVNYASEGLQHLAEALDLPLEATCSLPDDDFDAHRRRVTVAMCASLSESFSYNALESMLAGIPTIFGPAIDWAWQVPELGALAGVQHPGSVDQIADKLVRLLSDSAAAERLSRLAVQVAAERVEDNHRDARHSLQELADRLASPRPLIARDAG